MIDCSSRCSTTDMPWALYLRGLTFLFCAETLNLMAIPVYVLCSKLLGGLFLL